ITEKALEEINKFLLDENNSLINALFEILDKHGGIEEINKKAEEASKIDNLMQKLSKINSDYVKEIEWLIKQRDSGAFISIPEYRRKILGEKANSMKFKDEFAVTLELSACQYFPFFIDIAKDAIKNQNLVPGRIIRVRNMKEQEADGDCNASYRCNLCRNLGY
ncbi:MAG: hypothetical protein ACTSSM_10305, partial [Promethearchaeota archaeon]